MKLDIKLFSGGSYNYLYSLIEYTYVGYMKDKELDEMMEDLCNLLHDLEWCDSADIDDEDYFESVKKFKNKWLKKG